jgi:hypothetical protein
VTAHLIANAIGTSARKTDNATGKLGVSPGKSSRTDEPHEPEREHNENDQAKRRRRRAHAVDREARLGSVLLNVMTEFDVTLRHHCRDAKCHSRLPAPIASERRRSVATASRLGSGNLSKLNPNLASEAANLIAPRPRPPYLMAREIDH